MMSERSATETYSHGHANVIYVGREKERERRWKLKGENERKSGRAYALGRVISGIMLRNGGLQKTASIQRQTAVWEFIWQLEWKTLLV